jgi:hypothetical protein
VNRIKSAAAFIAGGFPRARRGWPVFVASVLVLSLAGVAHAAAWRAQTAVPAQWPDGRLSAISCTGLNPCMAVGDYVGVHGIDLTLSERWNGSHWSTLHPANPAGASDVQLAAVSCPAALMCVAAGRYDASPGTSQQLLIERWDGSSWAIENAPDPGGFDPALAGVACPSSTACVAVGQVGSGAGEAPLVEHWNGASWSVDSVPTPAGASDAALSGVSCSSPSACTAVGSFDNGDHVPRPLVERWGGTAWSIETAPIAPGTSSGGLTAVSCPTSGVCFAVGSAGTPGNKLALLERWNGSHWSIQSTPEPHADPAGVSCTAPAACTAVGSRGSPATPFALRWDGASWSIQRLPADSGVSGFVGVSCGSKSTCMAAGSDADPSSAPSFSIERWDGSHWTLNSAAKPEGAVSSELSGASCPSSTSCTAVGDGESSTENDVHEILIERWDPSGWSIEQTPVPAGETSAVLSGVSCSAAQACVAVGQYNSTTGPRRPLVEVSDPSGWATENVPIPAGSTDALLNAVSCTSASACTAVGEYTDSANSVAPLVERWNGGGWTIEPQALPTGTGSAFLNGVSCPAADACAAVGEFENGGSEASLSEEWNGSSWSTEPVPNPTGGTQSSQLLGVSCTSAPACVGVGGWATRDANLNLAEQWNGTAWVVMSGLSGAGHLNGVSCSAQSACMAAGVTLNEFTDTPTLKQWNGASWATPPVPKANVPGALLGVSCDPSGDCSAVGNTEPDGVSIPLVVRYS